MPMKIPSVLIASTYDSARRRPSLSNDALSSRASSDPLGDGHAGRRAVLHVRWQQGLHDVGYLRDLLGDRDPRVGEPGDLLGRGVLLALDDRAGVAEAHPRHLVH